MKKIFLIIIPLMLVVITYNSYSNDRSKQAGLETDEVMMPVEPDGGIGDGAPSLDELLDADETRDTPDEICVGEYCDGSMSGENNFTVLNIPLINGSGDIGCGVGLIFSPHTTPKTIAVLDATYKKLFSLKANPEIESDDIRNTVGTEDRLFYDGVRINENNTAILELSGETYRIYNCTIPEFKAQIEQSALQFNTVDSIEVYINNERWNWCDYSQADPEEDGCDVNPKYWITSK